MIVDLIGEYKFRLFDKIEFENKNFTILVHKGFEFDGASIPRSLWSIYGCPFGGLYSQAACIHDALYATHLFSKAMSDRIFYEAMIRDGVERRTAIQMYLAVRGFGQSAYDEKYQLSKNREFVEIRLKGNE